MRTALEVIGALVLACSIGGLVYVWPSLPQRVPQHFDFSGHVDAWGDRSTAVLLPIIGAVMYIGLSLLARIPHLYNYPIAITEGNAARLYMLGQSMLTWLKVEVVILFAIIEVQVVAIAQGRLFSAGPYDVLGMVVIVLGTMIVHIVAMVRAR